MDARVYGAKSRFDISGQPKWARYRLSSETVDLKAGNNLLQGRYFLGQPGSFASDVMTIQCWSGRLVNQFGERNLTSAYCVLEEEGQDGYNQPEKQSKERKIGAFRSSKGRRAIYLGHSNMVTMKPESPIDSSGPGTNHHVCSCLLHRTTSIQNNYLAALKLES